MDCTVGVQGRKNHKSCVDNEYDIFGKDTLIEALRAGRIPRWRDANTDRLEESLAGRGRLPRQAPLTTDGINTRIVAAVRPQLEAGVVDQELIDGMLSQLWNPT